MIKYKNCIVLIMSAVAMGCGNQQNSVVLHEDNVVFSEHPTHIAKINVQNFEAKKCSYSLIINELSASITCAQHRHDTISFDKVQQYLSYFYNIQYDSDSLQINDSARDSILHHKAFCIEIENRDGEKHLLSMYYKSCRDTTDILGRRTVIDLSRCYVQCDTSPLVVGQWTTFDILAPNCDYFD